MSASLGELYLAEPPVRYLVQPPIVVDCSVLAALLFGETGAVKALESISAKTLHAPFLIETEMASVAIKKHKAGLQDLAALALSKLSELQILLHASNASMVLAIANKYDLSAYDATYLHLAEQLKCPLVTFDRRLGAAALSHLKSLD